MVHLTTRNERKAKFTLAAGASDVLYFSALEGFSGRVSGSTNALANTELERLADRILSKTGLETKLLKKVRAKTVAISTRSKQELFEALWQRDERGFEFKHDLVRLILSPNDGELLAYRRSWGRTPASFSVTVFKSSARETACSRVVAHFHSERAPEANVSGPVVVCPNSTFGAAAMSSDTRRLAWVVELPKQSGYKNAMEVWIDADDGRVLGGEILW